MPYVVEEKVPDDEWQERFAAFGKNPGWEYVKTRLIKMLAKRDVIEFRARKKNAGLLYRTRCLCQITESEPAQ